MFQNLCCCQDSKFWDTPNDMDQKLATYSSIISVRYQEVDGSPLQLDVIFSPPKWAYIEVWFSTDFTDLQKWEFRRSKEFPWTFFEDTPCKSPRSFQITWGDRKTYLKPFGGVVGTYEMHTVCVLQYGQKAHLWSFSSRVMQEACFSFRVWSSTKKRKNYMLLPWHIYFFAPVFNHIINFLIGWIILLHSF